MMSREFCQSNRRNRNGWILDFLNQNASFNLVNTDFSSVFRPDTSVSESADQYQFSNQTQNENLWIVNSSDVLVVTAQIQAAASIQLAIQLAIALILSIVIADEGESKAVYEDLLQLTATNQSMRQQTGIVDSHDILVVNVDLEASIQIQILLQILLALIAEFELL